MGFFFEGRLPGGIRNCIDSLFVFCHIQVYLFTLYFDWITYLVMMLQHYESAIGKMTPRYAEIPHAGTLHYTLSTITFVKLTEEMKNSHTGNYITLLKEVKEDTNK